jgi:hypothetical protein
LVKERVTKPLGDILEQQYNQTKEMLFDFCLSSTITTGFLSAISNANTDILGIAIAGGAISTGIKYAFRPRNRKRVQPSLLLVSEMRKKSMSYIEAENYLTSLTIGQLEYQKDRFYAQISG